MTKEEQIEKLNSIIKAKIGVSKIDGVGVIALTDIKQGERLHLEDFPEVFNLSYDDLNELYPHVKKLILEHFPKVVNGYNFAMPDSRLLAYMNHGGDDSNYDGKYDTALKDIKEGEEITEDYTLMDNWDRVFPFIIKN